MSIFEKERFRIFVTAQHPLKHSLDDFAYTNPGLGNTVSTVQGAIDYLFAVIYPQSQPAVDTVGDLPAVGNTLNDMRVVNDDGDGKAASYRWEQREGEASPSWHKIYDMDWGLDSILQQMELKTQDLYVSKKGYDERDAAGNLVVGTLAGAYIYGGATANNNLTFFANSGDGVGASTGYVQFGDNARPITDNTFDFGTTALRFKKIWAYEYQAGTLNLQSGSITDTSGLIDFDNEDLTTTGTLTVGTFAPNTLLVGGTLFLQTGSITDSTGNITFDNENLVTTGTVGTGVLTVTDTAQTIILDPDAAGNASIASSRATLTFGATNLLTTGTLSAGNATVTRLDSDNIRVDGNTISVLDVNGNLNLTANGTGQIEAFHHMVTLGQTAIGIVSVTGQLNADNLRLDGNTISATNANGNITLLPNGTGVVNASTILPNADSTYNFGDATNRWDTLYLDGAISDGTTTVTSSTIQSLRDINVGVTVGMAIFYDGTKWIASLPDTEITHGQLAGLSADDHLQYLLLAGRSGGQSAIGGTGASDNLTFESTSHATKGKILVKDTLQPFTNASYSGSWSGTDLGGTGNFYRHVYTKGEHFNFRVENVSSDFSSSSQNPGRIGYNTTSGLLIYDTGSAVVAVGAQHSETDTSWNGTDVTKTVTVSGVADARKAIWQLKDNTNNFEIMYVKLTQTNATTVVIDVGYPLPAGTYRLIGVQ